MGLQVTGDSQRLDPSLQASLGLSALQRHLPLSPSLLPPHILLFPAIHQRTSVSSRPTPTPMVQGASVLPMPTSPLHVCPGLPEPQLAAHWVSESSASGKIRPA